MCSSFTSLISHLSQEKVGVALGVLTEGSIKKCNQDTKQTSANFVAQVSMENIHRNALTRRSWAVDPVLHHEATVNQVIFYYQVSDINYLKKVIRRGNTDKILRKRRS